MGLASGVVFHSLLSWARQSTFAPIGLPIARKPASPQGERMLDEPQNMSGIEVDFMGVPGEFKKRKEELRPPCRSQVTRFARALAIVEPTRSKF